MKTQLTFLKDRFRYSATGILHFDIPMQFVNQIDFREIWSKMKWFATHESDFSQSNSARLENSK